MSRCLSGLNPPSSFLSLMLLVYSSSFVSCVVCVCVFAFFCLHCSFSMRAGVRGQRHGCFAHAFLSLSNLLRCIARVTHSDAFKKPHSNHPLSPLHLPMYFSHAGLCVFSFAAQVQRCQVRRKEMQRRQNLHAKQAFLLPSSGRTRRLRFHWKLREQKIWTRRMVLYPAMRSRCVFTV